jgi:long-chain acyl-CoA synthetase
VPLLDLDLYRKDVIVSKNPLVRLSVIDAGRSLSERTLFFVHGFGGNAMQWRKQLVQFAEKDRVVALDLRGHGLSDRPISSYSMDELLHDLELVVAGLNLPSKFVLLGHSFGAAMAATYATKHPDRVERLVLIGAAVEFRLNPFLEMAFKLPPQAGEAIRKAIRKISPLTPDMPAYVLRSMYHHAMSRWHGSEIYPRISTPTLVIMGQRDFVFQQSAFDAVPGLIDGAQFAKISVSAHMVHLERPDAVNRAIARFMGAGTVSWRQGGENPRTQLVLQRPWLKHYERDVPYTLAYPPQPIFRFLETAARRHPRQKAIVFYDRSMTYRELNDAVNRFANALISLGVKQGDRVALLLPNSPQTVIAYYGALKVGAVVVSMNPLFDETELAHQLVDSQAETIVALSVFYKTIQSIKTRTRLRHVIVTNIKEYFSAPRRVLFSIVRESREGHQVDVRGNENVFAFQELLTAASANAPNITVEPDDLALIQYTTGTTDLPKGVMLTHAAIVANMVQIRHWTPDAGDGKDVFLGALPFSHAYGMTACMNFAILVAATMILLPTFSTREVLEMIARYHPSHFPGVPTMYVALNNYPNVRKYGMRSIRYCVSGAAPLPIEVQEAFEKLTRGRLVEGYGLTEAGPVTHANPIHGTRKTGSIGIPLPDTEARIVDLKTGLDAPTGEIGELVVRGPQVMRGYWNHAEETSTSLRDGWLYTGDLARMDSDGFFQIIDRKKDMILAGTYNVYPRDVEEVLYENPKVFEAAVTGVPHDSADQTVKAYVVLKKGEMATAEEFIEFCRERLAEYAVPKLIEFRHQLPKTFIGKVFKRRLVEGEGGD